MITVFGSINVDLVCHVAETPRPGETVIGSDYVLYPGGKGANQALAARRAGAKVRLVGAIGNDPIGSIALVELRAAEVDLTGIARLRGTTGLAILTVDRDNEIAAVVAPGANTAAKASAIPSEALRPGDTLLLQLEVPLAEVLAAARAAQQAGVRVILSLSPFQPLPVDDLAAASIIKVSESEAAAVARHLGLAGDGTAERALAIAERIGRTVVATLGPRGAIAAGADGLIEVPALAVNAIDPAGAGDVFAGVLAARLDEGAELKAAMQQAAVAASLACTKEGTQPSFPTRAEIEAVLRR